MRLTDEVINEIRNSASISEVIGHYIPLIKKGKGYTAVCPFHDDHDPSLSISEDKQIYKCFVCGNGGNVFNFVSNFKKVSFIESVKEVSEIIGKPIDIEISNKPKKVDKNQHLYDVLNSMINYTNYLLTGSKAGESAKEYLKGRGIEEDIINKFNIGFNPKEDKKKGIGYLYNYLHENSFKDEDMIDTGIIRMTQAGMKDVFFNRILFPIHDAYGNPIGFTARDFTNESEAKYINTSETKIYTKGNFLYNYHRAKEACKMMKSVIVVEGTMDVIALERAGISNVVAMLGTALTKKQLELLKSLSNNVILSFDGDRAGKTANLKNGVLCLDYGLNVEVIDNRSELDPDEILAKYGKNALKDLISKRISYIDFAINYYKNTYNLSNYQDRKEMTIKVSSLIDRIKDEYDRTNYENELYELTKIKKINTGNSSKKEYNYQVANKHYELTLDGLSKAEYTILIMMSISKDAKDIYQKDLGFMLDETNSQLAMYIIDEYRKYNECHLVRLLDEVEDEKIKNLITTLATIDTLPDKYDSELFKSAIDKVKNEIKKRKLSDLKKKITDNQTDKDKAQEYLNEYQTLLREIGGKNNAK